MKREMHIEPYKYFTWDNKKKDGGSYEVISKIKT